MSEGYVISIENDYFVVRRWGRVMMRLTKGQARFLSEAAWLWAVAREDRGAVEPRKEP